MWDIGKWRAGRCPLEQSEKTDLGIGLCLLPLYLPLPHCPWCPVNFSLFSLLPFPFPKPGFKPYSHSLMSHWYRHYVHFFAASPTRVLLFRISVGHDEWVLRSCRNSICWDGCSFSFRPLRRGPLCQLMPQLGSVYG